MARTDTRGIDLQEASYMSDLHEWMRTRSPFKRDALRTPRIRLAPDRLRWERWDVPVDPSVPVDLPHVDGIDSRYFRNNLGPLTAAAGARSESRHPANGMRDSGTRSDGSRQRDELELQASILRDEMRDDPSQSVPAWVARFAEQETRLQSLVNRGKFAEARDLYDRIRTAVDDNYDEIIRLTSMGWMGPDGEHLADMAKRIVNDEYLSTPMQMFDGSQVTLGALVRDGGQVMIDAAREEFDGLGLPPETAELMFNGSGQQQALLKSLLTPLLNGKSQVPDRQQRAGLIDAVVNRWDELEEVFGDGVAAFVQGVQDSHDNIGGSTAVLRTLQNIAARVKETRNLEGRALAEEVLGSYRDFTSAMFPMIVPPGKDGSQSQVRGVQDVPAIPRMLLDSVMSATVAELGNRGADVDLRNPVFMNAVLEAMDLAAYGTSAKIDLVGVGRASGRSIPQAVAEYVADTMTLDPSAQNQNNAVSRLRNLRSTLHNLVLGGHDFEETYTRMTGDPKDYLDHMSQSAKGWSSSPGADAVADAMRKTMFRVLAPAVVSGDRDAFDVIRDGVRAGSLIDTVASEVFAPQLAGPGARGAARLLANNAIQKVMEGREFHVQDGFLDLGFPRKSQADSLVGPAVRESIANWYNGNVASSLRFAEPLNMLLAHLTDDEKMPAAKAHAYAARVGSAAVEAERIGQDPMKVFEDAIAQGTFYAVDPDFVDDSGRPVLVNPMNVEALRQQKRAAEASGHSFVFPQDRTGLPVIVKQVGDRSRYGWTLDGDNSAYDGNQAQAKRLYDQAELLKLDYMKKAQTAQVNREYSDD